MPRPHSLPPPLLKAQTGDVQERPHPPPRRTVPGQRNVLSTQSSAGSSPVITVCTEHDDSHSDRITAREEGMQRLIEGFQCKICKADLTVLTGRRCSWCGGDEHPLYCISCTKEGCMKRFCAEHTTCWEKHLPRDEEVSRLHEQIDPLPQLFVNVVTHSEGDRRKQKQMHQRDEQARWFNIRRDPSHTRQDLFIYDRFIQLCDPDKTGNTGTKRHYPSFVSFVGDTSAGKSTLVRAMLLMGIANPARYTAPISNLDCHNESALKNLVSAMDHRTRDGPVTRSEIFDHQKYPTTFGVHLYKDEGVSMTTAGTTDSSYPALGSKYPILFADCEGFNAGEAITNAERLESTEDLEPLRGRGFTDPRTARSPSRRRDMAQQLQITASCYGSRGKDGIDLFYARFLYAVSDVIVFVTRDDAKIQMELTRVLEWASKAVHKSVNHPSRKTLIVVRNMANFHKEEYYDNEKLKKLYLGGHPKLWEDSEILKEFVKDYNSKPDRPFVYRITTNERLYNALFSNIVCCYVPNKKSIQGRPQELFKQYQRLRDTIEDSVREGLALRAESVMQYNVPALTHILSRAFEHFTTSEDPFDFYLAARKDNPNPRSMTEHVANFIRHVFEYNGDRATVDVMVKDVVSVALLTYTYREFSEGLGARPEEIFSRELQKICSKAIEMYIQVWEKCAFTFPNGQACTSRPAKLHQEHVSGTGQHELGHFVHQRQWRSDDKRDWINDIQQRFVESYEAIFIHQGSDHNLPPEKRLLSRRECGHNNYALVWKHIKSNKTCLSCLQAVPDHVLSCGHSYCARCVQELGEVSHTTECAWTMKCRLCWEARGGNLHLVQLRPRCAGVRILTLDGGGIKGIVELALLNALHQSVGLNLLPKDMFDLIVGTSTGGIIALALAMSNEYDSIPKMMDFFADISKKTFSNSLIKKITTYTLMIFRLSQSVFSSEALRKALQDHFWPKDTALFAPSLHTGLMSSGTRVAVTSAKDMGQTACLITSYNHPSGSVSNDSTNTLVMEREETIDKDMKIWEAALATSAAPFYLLPYEKPETKKLYVDGAVYANCPAGVAYSEMERIWPGEEAPLDTLVALGTGVQQAKSAQDVPSLVNMGFFVSLRAVFQRQIDSKSGWAAFRDTVAPPAIRCRLNRLDPPLEQPEYVEMYDWQKIDELKHAVEKWTDNEAQEMLEGIANTLLAAMFFFEPDGEVTFGQHNEIGARNNHLFDPSREILPGSIRCRLVHGSPELKKLLSEKVEYFGYYHLPLVTNNGTSTPNVLQQVSRVPEAMWQRIRMNVRGREARPSEMLYPEVVGEGVVHKFRLPYTLTVKKGSDGGLHVLAVKLTRCEGLVPISGFPSTHAGLVRRSKMKWLQ